MLFISKRILLFLSFGILLYFLFVHGSLDASSAPADGLTSADVGGSTTAATVTATVSEVVTTYKPQFTVPASADFGANLIPNILDPEAANAQDVCPGYVASDVKRHKYGFSATLSLAGDPCNVYGNDVEILELNVEYQNADRLAINIQPAFIGSSNSSWFLLDENVLPRPMIDVSADSSDIDNDFQVIWSNEPSFSFSVIRRSTSDVIFSTKGSVLVYEDQFIEFASFLPKNYNLYGLGETLHSFRLGNNYTATMFAADSGNPIDKNLYGIHPIYVDTRYYEVNPDTGNLTLVTANETSTDSTHKSYSHGVFLRNGHGQEVLLKAENVTWRTIGGSIDLSFLDGPSVPQVIQQYTQGVVGLPAMQQYFAFGYHQCRWGYDNISVMQGVVDNFRTSGIPLESLWSDIEYMDQYRDFSNARDTHNITDFQNLLAGLHASGQHWIPIVDSAIYIPNPENASDAYAPYDRGHELDVFIKNPDGSEYIGSVWPGYTVFPDWRSPNAVTWWVDEVYRWHQQLAFDGIWIDMSEVSSFCVGSCGTGNLTLNPVHPPFLLPGEPGAVDYNYPEGFNLTNATEALSAAAASASQASAYSTTPTEPNTNYLRTTPTPGARNVDHPPYVINHLLGDLAVHAVSPNATHSDGVEEYDVHSLWGHQILNATYDALINLWPEKRPFIIGRSTFAGSGKWAGHWGGDNQSKWYYLYFSIQQALSFSVFGIPMFGVDTCGFSGNSDEELCNRWMQLSAFFPFYRNHNVLKAASQEPYIWASVTEASKTAMHIRYSLLPYMYTLFHAAHTTGTTVMRALSWEFPDDPSLADAHRQFLLGPSLMVTAVLDQGRDSVNGVFPGLAQGEVWYDWYTQARVEAEPYANVTIPAPLGHIPVYVRGGSILPTQEPGYTTRESRRNPWGLLVALSSESTASGQLYVDDGESVHPNATLFVEFAAQAGSLYASARGEYNNTNPLANVTVMGVSSFGGSIKLNGGAAQGVQASYNETSKVLAVTGLEQATAQGAWSQDWSLSWV